MKDDIEKYWKTKRYQEKYESAIQQTESYINALNDNYKQQHGTGFIRFIEARIKSVDSICAKLERKKYQLNPETMDQFLNDLCGVRVVCFNTMQLYDIVRLIQEGKKYKILKVKDYVKKPKKNGYQSYHIVLEVPVKITDEEIKVKVEVQIRTILMDAWASLDASIRYKKKKKIPVEKEKKIESISRVSSSLDKIITSLMKDENKIKTD